MSSATTSGTVVGVFENQTQAQQAVTALRQQGYTDDQISVVSHNRGNGTERLQPVWRLQPC